MLDSQQKSSTSIYSFGIYLAQKKFGYLWEDTDLVLRDEAYFRDLWFNTFRPHAEDFIRQVIAIDPEWLGVSIFTQRTEVFAKYFSRTIKGTQTHH
jgi:hypothetical protein